MTDITSIETTSTNEDHLRWNPVVGNELDSLVQCVLGSGDTAEDFKASTCKILSQCVPPAIDGRRTGLVVGKVQSGKTLSFTAVAAAAHDNQYRLVIVLSGTKRILAQQTRDRLEEDLRTNGPGMRPWRTYHNLDASKEAESLRNLLDLWANPNAPIKLKKTVIITVHKNRQRLDALRELLVRVGTDRLGSPLIIDDEADQAGLNTKVRDGLESPTYAAILELRDAIGSHTYLQYTATPQGNLLIPLIDLLSPDFAHMLKPGEGYVGSTELFAQVDDADLLRTIPQSDIPDDTDPDAEPPASLYEAMRLFYIGVASWLAKDECDGGGSRSMMVHPSRLKNSHSLYARWVKLRAKSWRQILEDNENPDRDLIIEEFRHAYDDLANTVPDLIPFDDLAKQLVFAMAATDIKIVNSSGTNEIPWAQHPAWLLVGGANLDRGFTVEGLTVTYMPRGPGVGNADTIQQRGRFFGYKTDYLGYCRVFLESDIEQMFRAYVKHEKSFHDWLEQSIASGIPLSDLQRHFVIDRNMRPTRNAILSEDVARVRLSPWFHQQTLLQSLADCRHNLELLEQFVSAHSLQFQPDDPGTPRANERSDGQKHLLVEDVPLALLHDELLANMKLPGAEDTSSWLALLLLIEGWLDKHQDDFATIVRMRPTQCQKRAMKKKRGGDIKRLENPFQGAHPDKRGAIYPGDMKIRSNNVTLQVHRIDVYDGLVKDGVLLEEDVPVFALWLNEELRSDIISLE